MAGVSTYTQTICPYRVVIPTCNVDNLNVGYRGGVSILTPLHKNWHSPWHSLVLVGQFVAGYEELAVSVVAQLSVLWQTEGVEVAFLVHYHAELGTTCHLVTRNMNCTL